MSISFVDRIDIVGLACLWAAILAWTPAASTAAEQEQETAEIEQIVVTGSRIPLSIGQSDPVLVLDRETIRRSGVLHVSEALQQLTLDNAGSVNDRNPHGAFGASAVSFRGLGPGAVLVLVNGRRLTHYGFSVLSSHNLTSFVDLNSIPLAAVERIDVLKDGASALYGSDAIAGVINIVLRRDFTGAELSLRAGASEDGGADEKALSALWGNVRGSSSAQVMATYVERDKLYFRDRSISRTANHALQGGADFRSYAATNFWPSFPPAALGADCEERGSTINGIPEFELVEVPTFRGDFVEQCVYDFNTQMAEPGSERFGLNAMFHHRLRSDLAINMEASFARSRLETREAAAPIAAFFPETNPWNPLGLGTFATYRLIEAGPRSDLLKSDTIRVLAALEGSIHRWNWNAGLTYSKNETSDEGSGYVSRVALDSALNGIDLDGDGELQADEFLNLYSPASHPNGAALIDALRALRRFSATAELWSADVTVSGPLVRLRSGEINIAAGLEHREESLRDQSDDDSRSRDITRSALGMPAAGNGDRKINAVFAELLIPILSTVDVQAALRFDDYDDVGTQRSRKVAGQWQPLDQLTLHGSWSENFRAPTLVELHAPAEVLDIFIWDEVRCPTNATEDGCFLFGPTGFRGGVTALEPELADSMVFGFSATIPRGLTLRMDYWRIRHRNRIAFPSWDYILYSEDLLGTAYVVREPSTESDIELGIPGQLSRINMLLANLSRQRVSGYDVELTYAPVEFRFGQLEASVYWTRLLTNEFRLFPPGTGQRYPEEYVSGMLMIDGTLAFDYQENTGRYGIPENRVRLDLLWQRNNWEAALQGRWTDGFDQPPFSPLPAGTTVASHIEWDTAISYSPHRVLRLTLGVENLFDTAPPLALGGVSSDLDQIKGFPTRYYDMRGRFAYLSATLSMP